jgi:hypothetical protein
MGIFGKKKEDSSGASGWPAPASNKEMIAGKKTTIKIYKDDLNKLLKLSPAERESPGMIEISSLKTAIAELEQDIRDLRS